MSSRANCTGKGVEAKEDLVCSAQRSTQAWSLAEAGGCGGVPAVRGF